MPMRHALKFGHYVITVWIFRSACLTVKEGISPSPTMSPSATVTGLEIIDIVAAYPDGIRLSQLSETVIKRFGATTTFHTSSRLGLDFDDLLVFLEARNKLRIFRGVVFPSGSAVSKS